MLRPNHNYNHHVLLLTESHKAEYVGNGEQSLRYKSRMKRIPLSSVRTLFTLIVQISFIYFFQCFIIALKILLENVTTEYFSRKTIVTESKDSH